MPKNLKSDVKTKKPVQEENDDYAPIDDYKISDDIYYPQDDQYYYDLSNNTRTPSSATVQSVMPTSSQTGNNTPWNNGTPSVVPSQYPPSSRPTNKDYYSSIFPSPLPTSINQTGNGTIVPGNSTNINHLQQRLGGGAIAGIVVGILSIPFIGYGLRLLYKKFTNTSIAPERDIVRYSDDEVRVVGNNDIIQDPENSIGSNGDSQQEGFEMMMIDQANKIKTDETTKKLNLTRNSRKVIPLKVIEEEKPIELDELEDVDLSDKERLGEQQKSDLVVKAETTTLASLLQSQPKSSRITLDPIEGGPSSSGVSNLTTTPVKKSNVLGGGKED